MARTRSPNYPVVDLETAVDLATKLEKFAQRHPVPVDAAIEKAWSMKAGGSYGYQCVAALRQFGLIQEEEGASNRQMRLTEEGAKVVHNHPDRATILRQAALKPKVHATLAAHYKKAGLPPDDTIRTYLLFDHQPPFNPASVGDFISQLRKTIRYAGVDLSEPKPENVLPLHGSKADSGAATGGNEPEDAHVDVGDFVQWEAGGLLKLEAARRIRAITEDREWVFVDGSETGIPMDEVVLEKKGEAVAPPANLRTPPTLAIPMQPAGFAVSEAEREWLRGPLSRDVSYRLIVSGDMSAKEIGKLIKLLQAQQAVLADDDEEGS